MKADKMSRDIEPNIQLVIKQRFPSDWKKLDRSYHVKYDRQRSNRMLELKSNDEIMASFKVINNDKYYLFMKSGIILITTSTKVITILNSKMNFNFDKLIVIKEPSSLTKTLSKLKLRHIKKRRTK